ncbi:MAG: Cof-type HAD-IIB family hydrolase [Paenibacillaceae bacterium]
MRYKLIALDVDGTLINNQYEITESTRLTIQEVHRQGAHIVLCTGRGPTSTLPLLEVLGLEGTVITHNGAATVESEGSKLIHQFAFHMNQLQPFVDYCRLNQIHFDVNTAFEHYLEHLTDVEREMYKQYLVVPRQIDDVMSIEEDVVKISIYAESDVLDQLTLDWPNMGHPQLKIIRSGENFIDVMHLEANKGNALKSLANRWGIQAADILAIGNYYNDLEMLEFAGLGVVMDNSPEDMKQSADAITASNDEEGVHLALQQYCLVTTK